MDYIKRYESLTRYIASDLSKIIIEYLPQFVYMVCVSYSFGHQRICSTKKGAIDYCLTFLQQKNNLGKNKPDYVIDQLDTNGECKIDDDGSHYFLLLKKERLHAT